MQAQRLFTSARRKFLVTGIGQDRRGIARDISTLIFNEEGNITDSRISKSQQNFVLTFLVEIMEKNLQSFKQSLQSSREKLSIHLDASELTDLNSESLPTNAVLSIVSEEDLTNSVILNRFFSQREVVVNRMESGCFMAPMGGTELFKTLAYVTVNRDFLDFQERLKELDHNQIVSVEVHSGELI